MPSTVSNTEIASRPMTSTSSVLRRAMHQHLVDDHLEEQRRDQREELQEERRDQHLAQETPIFVDRAQEPGDVEAAGDVATGRPGASSGSGRRPRPRANSSRVIRAGRGVCGDWTRTLSSAALASTRKPPSRRVAMAGKGVLASRDQSVRQARALRPRSLAHRSISGAPILSVPSRCLICPRSAATPWKCSNVTRASSPGSAGVALGVRLIGVLQDSRLGDQACGCASNGCWLAAGSAIGVSPGPRRP